MNDFPVIGDLQYLCAPCAPASCLVPRRLSLDYNVRAKEGGNETTGVIGDLVIRTGLWDRQGEKHCELRVHTRVVGVGVCTCRVFYEKHDVNHFYLFLFIASLAGVFFGAR